MHAQAAWGCKARVGHLHSSAAATCRAENWGLWDTLSTVRPPGSVPAQQEREPRGARPGPCPAGKAPGPRALCGGRRDCPWEGPSLGHAWELSSERWQGRKPPAALLPASTVTPAGPGPSPREVPVRTGLGRTSPWGRGSHAPQGWILVGCDDSYQDVRQSIYRHSGWPSKPRKVRETARRRLRSRNE